MRVIQLGLKSNSTCSPVRATLAQALASLALIPTFRDDIASDEGTMKGLLQAVACDAHDP